MVGELVEIVWEDVLSHDCTSIKDTIKDLPQYPATRTRGAIAYATSFFIILCAEQVDDEDDKDAAVWVFPVRMIKEIRLLKVKKVIKPTGE